MGADIQTDLFCMMRGSSRQQRLIPPLDFFL